jgi:hypothetical protein
MSAAPLKEAADDQKDPSSALAKDVLLPTEPGVLKQGTRPCKLVWGGSSPPPGSVASSRCQTSAPPRVPREPGEPLGFPDLRPPSLGPRAPWRATSPLGDHKPWWSQTGSNRRPQACKASALPTELWPLPVTSEQSPVTRGKVDGRGTAEPGRAPRARQGSQARPGAGDVAPVPDQDGGPGTTRTSDLTLIRGAL